jgi:hypothetical protein
MINQIQGKTAIGSEVIVGTDQSDYISPLGGSDFIDGKKGFDSVYVFWPSTKFNITTIQGTTYLDAVSGASRSDKLVLRNVESIEFSDKIVSLEINDTYQNTRDKNNFDGGPGIDTVVYDLPLAGYQVTVGSAGTEVKSVNSTEGTDWLIGIERLQFKDKALAFDVEGHAGMAAKTLGLVFGTEAVHTPEYVGRCLDYLDNQNYSAAQLMHEALAIRLGDDAGNSSALVSFLYERVTGIKPSQTEVEKYSEWIASGEYTVDTLALYAADLYPMSVQLAGIALLGIEYSMPRSTT